MWQKSNQLKKHIFRKRKVEENRALGLSSRNSGHRNWPLKANNERKTNRVYTPLMCPTPDRHKELVRLDNHLRSIHKVKDNEDFKQFMKYFRTNCVPDSLNSLPEEEENELSTTDEEYVLHEEHENLKKIVKQDGYKYLKKVENIPFTDSEHDDWLQNRVYYFATRLSKSKSLIYIVLYYYYEAKLTVLKPFYGV